MRFLGLDLETSGSDIEQGAVPIEVGLARADGERFSALIGPWQWGGSCTWSDEAEQVHGITREFLAENGVPPLQAGKEARAWVREHFPGEDRPGLHVVGWNVAGFDMPFVARYLPKLRKTLSYRTVDLNAVLFTIVSAGVPGPTGEPWTYDALKTHVKQTSFERMRTDGLQGKPHEASYDALEALYSWSELKRLVRRA